MICPVFYERRHLYPIDFKIATNTMMCGRRGMVNIKLVRCN